MPDILMRPFVALQVAVHELREREDGQTTTEYAILLGFLAIAIIVALFFLRNVLAASSRTRPAPSPTRPAADPTPRRVTTARFGGPLLFCTHLEHLEHRAATRPSRFVGLTTDDVALCCSLPPGSSAPYSRGACGGLAAAEAEIVTRRARAKRRAGWTELGNPKPIHAERVAALRIAGHTRTPRTCERAGATNDRRGMHGTGDVFFSAEQNMPPEATPARSRGQFCRSGT